MQSGPLAQEEALQHRCAFNLRNDYDLYDIITNYSLHSDLTIVIEDIKPYSLKLTPDVIETCKFIGELNYRLKVASGFKVVMVSRYDIKKWVYDTFPLVCEPLIDLKIEKKMYSACLLADRSEIRVDTRGRNKRKASFIYVDDKIVTESMKHLYGLEKPKSGKGYKFGLRTHAFQALACASFYDKTMTD